MSISQQKPLTITSRLLYWAEKRPDDLAVGGFGYAALEQKLGSVWESLRRRGCAAQCVAMVLPHGANLAITILGAMRGAIAAPLRPGLSSFEYQRFLIRLAPKLVVGQGDCLGDACAKLGLPLVAPEELESCAASEPVSPTETALILPTSGTTSEPRFVPLTHHNLSFAARAIAEVLELSFQDRCLGVMPYFHIHGLSTLLTTLYSGGSVCCLGQFCQRRFWRSLQQQRITWYSASPAIHQMILDSAPPTFSHSLRLVRSASAPAWASLIEGTERLFGVPFIEAYGMTEAAPQIASNGLTPEQRKAGSVGRPAGPQVRIVDGEIWVRGENVSPICEGWLATGDLGYLDEEGFLFITGRLKDQINQGGEKISPLEVEQVLQLHPAVKEAAVFAVPHRALGEQVGAAVSLHSGASLSKTELRQFAAARLAGFKLPQFIRWVDRLPRSENGKLQRRMLGEQSSLQARVEEIWREVLDLEELAGQDNFFLLGGHSIAALRVLHLVQERLGRTISLQEFFVRPTLGEFVQALTEAEVVEPFAEMADEELSVPTTSPQRRLWFLHSLQPANPAYHMTLHWSIEGPLDESEWERALEQLVARQAALRSCFPSLTEQRIDPAGELLLARYDLARIAAGRRRSRAMQLVAAQSLLPFDLVRGPCFRAGLIRLEAEQYHFFFICHHLVFDGWSREVFRSQFMELLENREARCSASLTRYAQRHQSFLDSREASRQLEFWKKAVEGFPQGVSLPFDRPRPMSPTFEGATVSGELEADLVAELNRFDNLFLVTLGVFAITLCRLSGDRRFLIGTPVANRDDLHSRDLIGFLANTLPLPLEVESQLSFGELLDSLARFWRQARANRHLPVERLVQELGLDREGAWSPLFSVMFCFQNYPEQRSWSTESDLELVSLASPSHYAKFDLSLYLYPEQDRLRCTWLYSGELFDAATVEMFSRVFVHLARQVIGRPDDPVGSLDLLDSISKTRLAALEQARALPEPQDFMARFCRQAAAQPQAPALIWGQTEWCFAELLNRVQLIAGFLHQKGVRPGQVVALIWPRDQDLVACSLAVWYVGGTLLPLDPHHPAHRRDACLQQVEVALTLTPEVLELGEALTRPIEVDSRQQSAYIMFTSGSTALPKKVSISRSQLSSYLKTLNRVLKVGPGDRYLQTATIAFSSAMRQLLLPLCNGATIVGVGEESRRDPEALVALAQKTEVTIVDLVPSHWQIVSDFWSPLPALRLLLSASEPLPLELAHRLRRQTSGRLVNMYGQTETAGIVATFEDWTSAGATGCSPAGRPLEGLRLQILDRFDQPVPPGVVGQVHVSGPTVEGLYATGDLGRWNAAGQLLLLGRQDAQIKIRGFRVEPGEIEAVLREFPGVTEVLVSEEQGQLIATVAGSELEAERLPDWCRQRLPSFLVPSRFELKERLARTATGKLARPGHLNNDLKVKVLCSVWSEVLKVERVEPDDNFFALGGNSLNSVEVVRKVQQAGVALTLQELFQYQSVARLLQHWQGQQRQTELVRISYQELLHSATRFLERSGLDAGGAAIVARVQLESHLRGQPTHNLEDLPRYAKRFRQGLLNPTPRFRWQSDNPMLEILDGDHGPGQWVATVAMERAIEKARECGVGWVLVKRSNHFGAAGYYSQMASQQQLLGLCTTNGPLILAPTGGVTPTFGNNPIAVAIPSANYAPIVLDMALSVAPRGKIGFHLAEGKELPEGWVLDREGKPTTELAELAAGLGAPIGGHKGYGLALVMEVLAGVLSGAGFGWDHSRGRWPLDLGHLFLVVDPALAMEKEEFLSRVDRLLKQVKEGRRAEDCDEIFYPGEMEWRTREENLRLGVPVSRELLKVLQHYA